MFPRWLSWLVLGVMLYVLVQAQRSQPPSQLPTPVAPVAVESAETAQLPNAYHTVSETLDAEHWKKALNPDYAAKAQCSLAIPVEGGGLWWRVTEDKPGMGDGARCTQAITVALTVWNEAGAQAYHGTHTLHLGAREIAAGLDAALIGIRPGGVRTVVLAPGTYERAKGVALPKALAAYLSGKRVAVLTVVREQ